MLYGMGGSGKSLLAMHLAQTIAAGRERWFSYEVEPARVLYLDFELEYSVQGNRAFDVAAGVGLDDPPEGLKYVPVASTDAATAFEFAYAACQEHDCGLVVVDSVGPAMLGDAELAKDVIGFLNTYIKPFNALGKAVLMIDHQAKVIVGEKAKAKLPFGSVYKFNLSRSVIQVTGSQADGGIVATFDQKKSNFGPVQDEFKVQLEFSRDRIEVRDPDPGNLDNQTTSDKIMQALEDGPKYPAEIAEVLGIKMIKTVKNAITDLKKAQKVEPTGVTDQNGAQQVRLTAACDPKMILRNDAPKLERNDNHAA